MTRKTGTITPVRRICVNCGGKLRPSRGWMFVAPDGSPKYVCVNCAPTEEAANTVAKKVTTEPKQSMIQAIITTWTNWLQ